MSVSGAQAAQIIELYPLPDTSPNKPKQKQTANSYSGNGKRLDVEDYLSRNGRECIRTKQ